MKTQLIADPRALTSTEQASQWRLMWLSFRRHRLAVAGGIVVALMYIIAAFGEFFTPFDPNAPDARHVFHPPQRIHFIDSTDDGIRFAPYVYAVEIERDPLTLETRFAPSDRKVFIDLFGKSEPYRLMGFIPMQRKLLAPADADQPFYLLGSDRLGRDMFSRIVAGTRVSMSIGLVGVGVSLVLGLILGGLSGYYGGWIDRVTQRAIELILSLPTIPIWLGLSAAMPSDWSPITRYFAITIILSLVGWTELARVVRGRFLSLRTDDFVIAAKLDGGSQSRVIFRHMMPSMISHIIASVTLAIPVMILAETSLSFLGLGLLPPTVSWGVLLKEAQNIRSIAEAPWLFFPGVAVCFAVLAFNFLGDGLRDAADPYSQEGR